MDPKTGHIHLDPTPSDVIDKALVPIPEGEAEKVINMNRKQRRAWAAAQRRKAKASR